MTQFTHAALVESCTTQHRHSGWEHPLVGCVLELVNPWLDSENHDQVLMSPLASSHPLEWLYEWVSVYPSLCHFTGLILSGWSWTCIYLNNSNSLILVLLVNDRLVFIFIQWNIEQQNKTLQLLKKEISIKKLISDLLRQNIVKKNSNLHFQI